MKGDKKSEKVIINKKYEIVIQISISMHSEEPIQTFPGLFLPAMLPAVWDWWWGKSLVLP